MFSRTYLEFDTETETGATKAGGAGAGAGSFNSSRKSGTSKFTLPNGSSAITVVNPVFVKFTIYLAESPGLFIIVKDY